MVTIKIDVEKATRTLLKGFAEVSEKQIRLSVMRAINDTLRSANNVALANLTGRYNFQRKDLAAKMKIYKASSSSPFIGYLKYYNKQFSLKDFNPKEINDGVATFQMGRGKSRAFAARKVNGLRANKLLVKHGIIVRILKGQDKIIPSAYLAFRKNKANPSVSARGTYGASFNFDTSERARGLMSVSMRSMLAHESVTAKLLGTTQSTYEKNLTRELKKRLKQIGEQHAR